ncbi:MAG TPA: murein biosynthesis integral membrane protein MurJ [Longimicrobiales bacterium]|nr:murein biosynthesis integral membrane protein MurJ [Longimicrobiales bacterium]
MRPPSDSVPPDPIESEVSEPGSRPAESVPAGSARPSGMSAQLVATGIFLSRIAGLVREGVFSNYFGAGGAADAFRAALRMPNVLQNLLGEGVLSASFIPVYSELLERGRKEDAGRVAGAIFALLAAVAGGLALIGLLLAPLLVRVFAYGFYEARFDDGRYALTVALVRIIFPMTGILVLSAWALGVLNSHRRFFVPYVAPVLWNAAMIATMLIFGERMEPVRLASALAWGALLGGALQFLIQVPFVVRVERSLRVRWDTRLEGVRTTVRNATPAIMGRGVVQLSGWLDLFLASFLAAGAVAVIGFAQTLYVLPISLFGMSVAAAELPELARERGQTGAVLRTRVNRGLEQISFFVVPSLIGYVLLGDVVVGALYERGRFDEYDTILVAMTLAAFSIGLVASTATRLFSSAFFALQDTKTPAKYAVVRVVLAAALGASLMVLLDRYELAPGKRLGPVGLALGAGTAAWVEWWLLRRSLKPRIGTVGTGRHALGRMFLAALLAGGVARAVEWWLPEMSPLITGVIVLPVYAVLYFAIASRLGLDQASLLLGRVLGRFRRRGG